MGVQFVFQFRHVLDQGCIFPAQHKGSGEITFYMKGADAVTTSIVHYSDWLDEEVNV